MRVEQRQARAIFGAATAPAAFSAAGSSLFRATSLKSQSQLQPAARPAAQHTAHKGKTALTKLLSYCFPSLMINNTGNRGRRYVPQLSDSVVFRWRFSSISMFKIVYK